MTKKKKKKQKNKNKMKKMKKMKKIRMKRGVEASLGEVARLVQFFSSDNCL